MHSVCATSRTMKRASLPAVCVEAELLEELEALLAENETISTFVVQAVQSAVTHRRAYAALLARAEGTWRENRTAERSVAADEAFDEIERLIDETERLIKARLGKT